MQPLNSSVKMADDGLLTVQVTVPRGRMIKSSRGDESFTSFVRVDFGSRSHCETARVLVTDGTALYGDTASSFDIQASSRALLLDELSHKPLVLSVVESMPKDKKAKEEKTVVLGQSIVDLMPFLRGEKTVSQTVAVFPCNLQSEDKPTSDLPELDVLVSLPSPLLTEEEVEAVSFLSIKASSLYSLPDGWQLGGSQYQFTLSLPIPIGASQETTIAIPNGQLRAASDHDPPNWRWSYTGTASGPCIYKPDSVIKKIQYKDENGELRSAADIPFRSEAESQKPRVTWNAERRCLLNAEASSTLQSMIAQSRVWPVEVFRTLAPQSGKTKKEEEVQPSYHGVAYVNLTPLLYPGVSKVSGAYCLQPYVDTEVQEKTKRKIGSTLEVAIRSVSQAGARSIASARKGKRQSVVPPPKSGLATSSFVVSDTGDSIPEVGETKNYVEAKAYTDARSYIVLELSLDSPLIPKCPPEVLAQLVSEYIPPRSTAPKRQGGADQAVREFQTQVSNVAWCVLEEFRSMFGERLANYELPHSAEAATDRRRQLLYELNTSGKYYQFKEQLKLSVVKLVREKFLRTSPITDKNELHSFLSQLYVYLTDEMHCTLSRTFSLEDPRPAPPPVTNTNFLKHFAREAEMNENYEKAAQYYQERLAQDKNSRDHWYDYGRFCLVVRNYEKAQECFKEAVALDQNHMESLLMYALVAAIQEHHDIAETFFEAAAAVDPRNVIVWTVMGLYYESIGNDVNAEMAFLEAEHVNPQVVIKEGSESAGMSDGTGQHSEMSHHSAPETEQTVTVPEIKTTSPLPQVNTEGDEEIQDFEKSNTVTPQAKPQRQASNQAIFSGQHKTSPSPTALQDMLSPQVTVPDTQRSQTASPATIDKESIFLQVSHFLLEVHVTQWAELALSHELLQPHGGPSSPYYMALACVNMQKKKYTDAKTQLNEALSFDYHHPDSWALLGHSSYMLGDMGEAREAYERVLDFIGEACDMHTVYLRLGSIYIQEEQFTGAKHTFLLACKRSPSCITWLGVGIACYRMGELAEAEDALCEANILNNTDPQVWGYLALICLKTGRKVEAEQAYKYAFKLNLSDDKLLNEIRAVQKEVGFGDPSVTYQFA